MSWNLPMGREHCQPRFVTAAEESLLRPRPFWERCGARCGTRSAPCADSFLPHGLQSALVGSWKTTVGIAFTLALPYLAVFGAADGALL